MKGYKESGLVPVRFAEGETLSDELGDHFLTANDDQHPRLLVQNTAIGLHPFKETTINY